MDIKPNAYGIIGTDRPLKITTFIMGLIVLSIILFFSWRMVCIAVKYHPFAWDGMTASLILLLLAIIILRALAKMSVSIYYNDRMEVRTLLSRQVLSTLWYNEVQSWHEEVRKDSKSTQLVLKYTIRGETHELTEGEVKKYPAIRDAITQGKPASAEEIKIMQEALQAEEKATTKQAPRVFLGMTVIAALIATGLYFMPARMVDKNNLAIVSGPLASKPAKHSKGRSGSYIPMWLKNHPEIKFSLENDAYYAAYTQALESLGPGDTVFIYIKQTDQQAYILHTTPPPYWSTVFWTSNVVDVYGIRSSQQVFLDVNMLNQEKQDSHVGSWVFTGLAALCLLGCFSAYWQYWRAKTKGTL